MEIESKRLIKEVEDIKKLMILLLKHFKVGGEAISSTLGVSQGRLSQVASKTKYKKKK